MNIVENQNPEFIENLESAKDKIQIAISNISYIAYPDVNKKLIKDLEDIENSIEDILFDIESRRVVLNKPTN